MRFPALLLAAAFSAAAQDSLQIVADDNSVLVGRILALQAILRDSAGNPLPAAPVTWTVSPPQLATISPTGELRPLTLGIVRVAARSGSLFAEIPIQLSPREVRLSPPNATLAVGATLQFRAEALDADGLVIPNVAFAFQANNRNGIGTSVISLTNSGLLTARSDGAALVRATYTYNESVTSLQRDWVVTAPVEVVSPPAYRSSLLLNSRSSAPASFELRSRPSMLWGTDDGQLFFNANLHGLANGLLNWQAGAWRIVTAGGQPRFTSGSLATEFRTHSILPGGQILTWEETTGNGSQLNRGDRLGLRPFLTQDAPIAGTVGTDGISITRNSSTSSGWVLLRASFRFPGLPQTFQGLFRGFGARITELLIWDGRPVEDFPRGFVLDYDFGITDDGVAFYSLSNQGRRIFYRHHTDRTRLLGVGDPLLGASIRSLAGGRDLMPGYFVAENGEFLLSAQLDNDQQYLLRFPPGSLANPRTLRLSGLNGILSHHPTAGTLLSGSLPDLPAGAILWPPDASPRLLHALGQPLLGQSVEEIEAGTLHASGESTLILRTNASPMSIIRLSDPPRLIARHGDTIPVSAPLNLSDFVGGGRLGPPHLLTGGSPSSIALLDNRRLLPVAALGDRLLSGPPWSGAFPGSARSNARKSPSGDLFFTAGPGILRVPLNSTTPQLFLRFPLTLDNVQLFTPSWVDANSRGDLLWFAFSSAGDGRLFLTRNGTEHRLLLISSNQGATATTLDGRLTREVNSFTLDDDGRVLVSLQFRNDAETNLYLWSNGLWQPIARTNETRIQGRILRAIPQLNRAGGRRLFSLLSLDGGQVIAEWKAPAWEILVDAAQTLSHGHRVGNIFSFDVNRQGDLLFHHSSGTPFLVVRRGDRFLTVANLYRPVADRLLLRLLSLDFRDDGTVYFLAVTSADEAILCQAQPL